VASHAEDPINIDHQALEVIRPMLCEGVAMGNTEDGGVGTQVLNYLVRCDVHFYCWRRDHWLLL
jgi:hypothetical protein